MASFQQFVLGLALQTAQGQPAATPQIVTVVRSAEIAPNKETAALEETGQGRDQPAPVVTRISGGGNFELYLRPLTAALLAYGAFGGLASVAGAPPADSTHLATPEDDQPFFTVWRHMFGSSENRLVEKFMDCKVTQFQVQGSAGQPAMTLTSNLVGLRYERLTDMPAGGTFDTSEPLKFVDYEISLDGIRNRAINEFNYNLTAGVNTAQTDQLYDSYSEPGDRMLEVSFTEVFQNLATYNRTLYGSPTGTNPSSTESRVPMNAVFKGPDGTPRLTLDVPQFKYGTAPLTPSASANEIGRVQVTGAGDLPEDDSPVTTAEIVSGMASYAAAP